MIVDVAVSRGAQPFIAMEVRPVEICLATTNMETGEGGATSTLISMILPHPTPLSCQLFRQVHFTFQIERQLHFQPGRIREEKLVHAPARHFAFFELHPRLF